MMSAGWKVNTFNTIRAKAVRAEGGNLNNGLIAARQLMQLQKIPCFCIRKILCSYFHSMSLRGKYMQV